MLDDGQGVLFSRGKAVRGFFPYPTDLRDVGDMIKAALVEAK
jgi:hypothetical protein